MCRFAVLLIDVYTFKLTLDQRRMEEIIANLTKMRFGDQEQTKFKDIKEVQNIITLFAKPTKAPLSFCTCFHMHVLIYCCFITIFYSSSPKLYSCVFVWFQPAGGLYSRLEAQFKASSQSNGRHSSSEKTLRYHSHLEHRRHCTDKQNE